MIVNIRLNLPKNFNKLLLRYNTYEKISYDKYFIASLLSETRDKKKAEKIIDALTGKGSLNAHFVKLYEEIKELSKQDIEKILKDSLYPIQKIEEHRYIYIPMLNISIFDNRIFSGNLSDDEDFPKQLVEEGGSYISHNYVEPEIKIKPDNYTAFFTDEKIEINIDNKFYPMSQNDFQSIVIKEELDLSTYQGQIHDTMKGNDWIQLAKSTLNNILDAKDYYYEDGDHFGIYNDGVKRTGIAYRWGIYWVKDIVYRYRDSISKNICTKAARILMGSGRINEIKVATLMDILRNISRDEQQEIINYVLSKKDVKELATNGLYLVEKGYEKGWNDKAIKSFYKFHETEKQLISIYRLTNIIEYSIDDLLKIYKMDKTVLSDEHTIVVDSYYLDVEQIRSNINIKIGEMMSSGIRENIGKMPLDDHSKKLRKYLNSLAHFEKDIKDKNLNILKQYEDTLNENYETYKIVKQRWEEFRTKI